MGTSILGLLYGFYVIRFFRLYSHRYRTTVLWGAGLSYGHYYHVRVITHSRGQSSPYFPAFIGYYLCLQARQVSRTTRSRGTGLLLRRVHVPTFQLFHPSSLSTYRRARDPIYRKLVYLRGLFPVFFYRKRGLSVLRVGPAANRGRVQHPFYGLGVVILAFVSHKRRFPSKVGKDLRRAKRALFWGVLVLPSPTHPNGRNDLHQFSYRVTLYVRLYIATRYRYYQGLLLLCSRKVCGYRLVLHRHSNLVQASRLNATGNFRYYRPTSSHISF